MMAYTYEDKIAFVQQIAPFAIQISTTSGLSFELMIAQAVQETGWGQSVLAGTNNIYI